jgi:uncharacterized membrane protein (DUF485 family)
MRFESVVASNFRRRTGNNFDISKNSDICRLPNFERMGMNKNTVLAIATLIMIAVGLILIALGAFRYNDVAGWGFAAVGLGFFAIAWVFNALKGRV